MALDMSSIGEIAMRFLDAPLLLKLGGRLSVICDGLRVRGTATDTRGVQDVTYCLQVDIYRKKKKKQCQRMLAKNEESSVACPGRAGGRRGQGDN